MSKTILTIEGIIQLSADMWQEVEEGKLRLSLAEWRLFDDELEEVRKLISVSNVSYAMLEDAAWLMVAAFEHVNALSDHFSERLAVLTGGTKLTARDQVGQTDKSLIDLLKNKMIYHTKKVKKQRTQQSSSSMASSSSSHSPRTKG